MRRKRADHGAAAVEFALVLPILLTLMLGVIEFGYAMFVQSTLAGAAREGARDLAIHKDPAVAIQVAVTAAEPLVNVTGQVTADASQCASTPPGPVSVTITHPYTGLGGLGWFGLGSITISGRGVMRCGG